LEKISKKVKKISRAMQRFASLLHHKYRRLNHNISPTQLPNLKNLGWAESQEAILVGLFPNGAAGVASLRRKFRP
jgi:hypothetical protein